MAIRLETISAGLAKPLWVRDGEDLRTVTSAINKTPISTIIQPQAVEVTVTGIVGDEQADPQVHGGTEKALYMYPQEHYPFWSTLLSEAKGQSLRLEHGYLGENLTISGLSEHDVYVGDRLRIGAIECAVTKLREPCYKFTAKTGVATAAKAMIQGARSGWYLRVLQRGVIQAGDAIMVIPGPRECSIAQQNHALLHRGD
ncbi:MOSC domain-containing protein [Polynucleobacter sp. HIN6]|uniref:MOSC domain-containing protein n=1 Tax=Polynucleobacter sp. HIN6 TaxID=3047865 RepID=UPI00257268C2|nr:MOSC domain-containing protein [Polynucleobacter sp. HIN6]BEI35152.1 MOSC domain-containing protein [Polynucleobacter sp. HIN6]